MSTRRGESRVNFRRWPLALLALLVVLFFLPQLAGWERIFFDDIAFIFYPQQVFLARHLARSVIPWWNSQLCAGATPFYAHVFQSSLSPLNWLFLAAANLDPVRNYLWLIKLPLVVSFLLSAVFSYLFSRRGLELDRPGSAVFAVAYTFSPFMIYFSTCPPEVYIQAWLPFLCLCLVRFARGGRWWWPAAGAAAWALASPAGDVPVAFQVVLLAALFASGTLAVFLREGNRRGAFRVVLGGVAVFAVGSLLSGVYWSNMIVGLRMLGEGTDKVVEGLSGLPQSLHPLYLITVLIPDYFGGVTSHHTWGAAFSMKVTLNDVNLLGGLAGSFLVFLGFFLAPPEGEDGGRWRAWRRWWWLFAALFIFGVLVVLGAYTPVHGVARNVIPILRMPYPVRFRSIECFALAGLLGVSTSLLLRSPLKNSLRKLAIFTAFVLPLAGLLLLYPYRTSDTGVTPGWRHLAKLGDWSWFLTGPLLYLAAVISLLAFLALFRRGRYLRPLLIILVFGEMLWFAYRGYYFNQVLNFRYRDFYARRYRGPAEQPQYRRILSWRPEQAGEAGLYRRLYFRSYFDNLAWLDGSLSMLGFDIKPIDRRFQGIVEELADGFPYEIWVRRWSSRFWPNMSARYILAEKPLPLDRLETRGRVGEWYSYEDPTALPRVYFLDRVVECSEEEARRELMEGDLRRGVFVEDSKRLAVSSEQLPGAGGSGSLTAHCLPLTAYDSFDPGSDEEYLAHFEELQQASPITRLDFSNPNRVLIEAELSAPAMLVMTDLHHPDWRAELDGEPAAVCRVNYLQRGVWCPAGRRRLEMSFRPSSLVPGLALSGAGILAWFGLVALAIRPPRGRRDEEV